MFNYIKSYKGKQLITYKNFIYRRDTTKRKKDDDGNNIKVEYYRCVEEDKLCTSRCNITNNTTLKDTVFDHNHDDKSSEIEVKIKINEMKTMAIGTLNSPSDIISSSLIGLNENERALLPSNSATKKMIQRARSGVLNIPPDPKGIDLFDILGNYTLTSNGELFLLEDTGRNLNRVLVFATSSNLQILKSCKHWMADGTFSKCPRYFTQIWSIHGLYKGEVIPLVFAVLPNKKTASYYEVLKILVHNIPDLNPSTILTDFEKGQIKAFKKSFSNITPRGCYFHFTQALYKRLGKTPGLQKYYKMNTNGFKYVIMQIFALSLLPPDEVYIGYKTILDDDFFQNQNNLRLCSGFIEYLEKNWIGDFTGPNNSWVKPKIDIECWNQQISTLMQLPRCNNNIEGWHHAFASTIPKSNPSIWTFITAIKKQQVLMEYKVSQINSGHKFPKNKKYLNQFKKRKALVASYQRGSAKDFLIGISRIL